MTTAPAQFSGCSHSHHEALRADLSRARNVRPSEVFGEPTIAADCACGSTLEVPATIKRIRENILIHARDGRTTMVQAFRAQLSHFFRPVDMVVCNDDCRVYVTDSDDVELIERVDAEGVFETPTEFAARMGMDRPEMVDEMLDRIALELADRRAA